MCGKRTSALNFASVQISNVKYSTVMSEIYHDKMNTIEQASTNVLMRIMNFHSMKGHHSKSLKVDKLTRGLSFSGLPFPLTAKSRLLPVSYD